MGKGEKTESKCPPGYCLSDWLDRMIPFTGIGKISEIEQEQL